MLQGAFTAPEIYKKNILLRVVYYALLIMLYVITRSFFLIMRIKVTNYFKSDFTNFSVIVLKNCKVIIKLILQEPKSNSDSITSNALLTNTYFSSMDIFLKCFQ